MPALRETRGAETPRLVVRRVPLPVDGRRALIFAGKVYLTAELVGVTVCCAAIATLLGLIDTALLTRSVYALFVSGPIAGSVSFALARIIVQGVYTTLWAK